MSGQGEDQANDTRAGEYVGGIDDMLLAGLNRLSELDDDGILDLISDVRDAAASMA